MDHIVYLDYKDNELHHLLAGEKTMIIRGAMGRKYPYGELNINDVLYFTVNDGSQIVRSKALIQRFTYSDKLSKEESMDLVLKNQKALCLKSRLLNRFGGKRYIVLIEIKGFKVIDPFKFTRSAFGNMDDWLPVGNIEEVKI